MKYAYNLSSAIGLACTNKQDAKVREKLKKKTLSISTQIPTAC